VFRQERRRKRIKGGILSIGGAGGGGRRGDVTGTARDGEERVEKKAKVMTGTAMCQNRADQR
jgi:hypothetical protein